MLSPPESAAACVAVILVNWNAWRECIECLDSILAQEHANFHVFIVDNESADRSLERIAAWCAEPAPDACWRSLPGVARYSAERPAVPVATRSAVAADCALPRAADDCRVTLLRSGGNLGFAGGCNAGIKAAGLERFEYFWFLNTDTVVDHRALSELIARARLAPGMGIVGSTVRFYHAPGTVQALSGGRLNRRNASSSHIGEGSSASKVPSDGAAVEKELAFVFGASMLVSAVFVRDVGLMQEDYFLYYEEMDWAMRGGARYRLGYAPQSHVFHKSGASSSKVMPRFSAALFYGNRLRFASRFLPDRMAAAKRKLFEEMLRHVARGRWGLARAIWSTLLTSPKV